MYLDSLFSVSSAFPFFRSSDCLQTNSLSNHDLLTAFSAGQFRIVPALLWLIREFGGFVSIGVACACASFTN